jgi:hypothetical protein
VAAFKAGFGDRPGQPRTADNCGLRFDFLIAMAAILNQVDFAAAKS